jgi:hypothetical protein
MTCDPERLSNYLDGELDPAEEAELREHLTACSWCEVALAAYRRVDESFRDIAEPPPPLRLRASLYRRLEDRRRSRVRRVLASPLLAPAVPITAAVLVAGGVAAWRQLPAGTAPVMTAAFAIQELPDTLDGMRVELVFDRSVTPESIAEAVEVEPALPLAKRVHENRVELIPQAPVAPGTTYRLVVNNVRDDRGNTQSTPVVLNLRSGPAALIVQESSPPESPRPTAMITESAPPATPPSQAQRGSGQDAAPSDAVEAPATAVAKPTDSDVRTRTTATLPPTTTPIVLAKADSAIPTPQVPAVVGPGSVPTSTVLTQIGGAAFSSAAATMPPASKPAVLASPLPAGAVAAAPASPPVSQSNQRSGTTGANGLPTPQYRLGASLGASRTVQLGEQAYQGGAMLLRNDTHQVLVLVRSTSRWLGFASTWRPGEVLPPAAGRPPGTWEPLRGFGKVWREQPAVKSQLGWPVFEERNAAGAVQSFDNGTLIRTAFGVAYALFHDGTWQSMPDRR